MLVTWLEYSGDMGADEGEQEEEVMAGWREGHGYKASCLDYMPLWLDNMALCLDGV